MPLHLQQMSVLNVMICDVIVNVVSFTPDVPGYLAEEDGITNITLFVPGMFFGCFPMSNLIFFSSPRT